MKRTGRHLLIVAGVVAVLAWFMTWIIDVPARWPDHGLAELDAEAIDLVAAACLVSEVEADPAGYGVGDDFRFVIDETGTLEIESRWRSSDVRRSGGAVLVEENRPFGPDPYAVATSCPTW
ncbi:MAG: hypothetical protein OEP52_13325 [Acidimicrobiia bacterium]|nr:hypothetical protein [Acidimicrobiia bacterium]